MIQRGGGFVSDDRRLRFSDEFHAAHEVSPIFERQRRQQGGCNCATPATILSSIFRPAGASKTSAERRSWPLSRLVIRERAAIRLIISPSVLRSTRICRARSVSVSVPLLVQGQEHAELSRRNVILCGQLLIEQVDAGIEQTHQKAEAFVELEGAGDLFR